MVFQEDGDEEDDEEQEEEANFLISFIMPSRSCKQTRKQEN